MTRKITPKTFPKYRPNPLFAGMPDYLKDPDNYEKIQRALLDAGATRHSHAEVIDWAGCRECQKKQWARKEMMKKLGFQSGRQYLEWKKVHDTIKSRVQLPKYNTK